MLHAYRGVGKTHVALGVASAVATGGKFLTWQAEKPRKVLFLDGEMPGVVLQERLRSTMRDMDKSLADNLIILTPDLQSLGMPDLATTEGQKRLEPYITNDLALIVVDNISTLCRTGQENKADSWQTMQAWALNLRARGKSVMLVHHDGKNGQQRGSSKKEDILDTVIQLKRPADYNSSEGAVFEIRFTKARGLWGEAVAALEAKLVGDEWTTRMVEESTREKVKALLSEGWKQKDIAEELEISKGLVSRYAKDN
jgi:RecA-family ATPase